GQVISRTDTGKDAVDLANTGCACRYKTANAGQQGNQGNLTHIGGLTAHIRAGNQQHATLCVHFAVVGREALDAMFHHRVTACLNPDAGLFGQLGGDPVIVQRMQRQGGQGIQFSQGTGAQGQGPCIALQLVQQFIEQELLAAQAAVLGGQDFVFPLFQFRRDEALGIFQCLASAVVVGNFVGLTAADFNKETVHPVVFDAQGGNAGALAFAGFDLDQHVTAVTGQAAQLVQIGVVAVGNDTAIAYQQGRLGGDGRLQQAGQCRIQSQAQQMSMQMLGLAKVLFQFLTQFG